MDGPRVTEEGGKGVIKATVGAVKQMKLLISSTKKKKTDDCTAQMIVSLMREVGN